MIVDIARAVLQHMRSNEANAEVQIYTTGMEREGSGERFFVYLQNVNQIDHGNVKDHILNLSITIATDHKEDIYRLYQLADIVMARLREPITVLDEDDNFIMCFTEARSIEFVNFDKVTPELTFVQGQVLAVLGGSTDAES